MFEAKVGKGRLLVTSVNLDADDNPVVAQLRMSLLEYLKGKPGQLIEVNAADIRKLYE